MTNSFLSMTSLRKNFSHLGVVCEISIPFTFPGCLFSFRNRTGVQWCMETPIFESGTDNWPGLKLVTAWTARGLDLDLTWTKLPEIEAGVDR